MKNHVHADRPWDTYTIVTVMRGFLPTIFADLFPDPFRAKEFLAGILQVVKVRNDRSHQIRLTEASVLNAMHQMGRVLKLAGLSDAATNIDSILEKAKHILAECPNEGEHIFTLDLSKEECNTQLLYVSMNAFEAHLEAQIASFQYQDKTIGTPTSRAFHLERQITIPPFLPFSPSHLPTVFDFNTKLDPHLPDFMELELNRKAKVAKWKAKLRTLAGDFKRIAFARHWYFHHLPEPLDVASVFTSMASVSAVLTTVQQVATTPWKSPLLATGGSVGLASFEASQFSSPFSSAPHLAFSPKILPLIPLPSPPPWLPPQTRLPTSAFITQKFTSALL
jgi:hypothetical protein